MSTRTPKASFEWYREVVRTGAVPAAVETTPVGDHQGIDIAGVHNARGIGGLETLDGRRVVDGLFFRTAGLHGITHDGRRALTQLGVDTILDLRGTTEVTQAPDEIDGVRLMHLPLHEPSDPEAGLFVGAAADESGESGLGGIYRQIVQTRGGEIAQGLRAITAAQGAVLAHCTAGKDRTGVFVAILLAALGVRDADIVRTYAQSSALLGTGFRAEVSTMMELASPDGSPVSGAVLDDLLASPRELIEEVLDVIRHDHGTVPEYLRSHGFSPEDLTALRRKLVA